jgi:hypothetical protein
MIWTSRKASFLAVVVTHLETVGDNEQKYKDARDYHSNEISQRLG